jgi:hypothetical protein
VKEQEILKEIRLAIGGRPDVLLWRNSTGTAEYYDRHGRCSRVPYGLCVGASDLIGVIKPTGTFLALEVKTARGRVRPEQKRFIELVRRYGGVADVVRSVEEAHAIINEHNKTTGVRT